MKRNCNLFSFFARGVTATHPLCSVFILCLIFVFCSFSVSVRAASSNIPELSGWQFQQAIDAYAGLTADQRDIANFLTGSQGYAFAGIANSNLNSNFSSFSDTINSAKDYGAKMWGQITDYGNSVANNMLGITNDLSNFFASSVAYAKTRSESFSAWLGNVGIDYNSSSEFRIQFGKDQAQNNIDFYGEGGLYQWQFSSTLILPSDFDFVWNTTTMSGSSNEAYYRYLNNMAFPHVRAISSGSNYNAYVSGNVFTYYHNIFVNLTNNTVYLCDDNGNKAPYSSSFDYLDYFNGSVRFSNNTVYTQTLNFLNYGNLRSLFTALNNQPYLILNLFYTTANTIDFSLSDFVEALYIGYTWDDKAPWTSDFDLNLSPTSQYVTVNSPTNVIYLDLNGFMHDLYDNPTIIYNYVIDNSVDPSGNPVTSGDFDPISKYITIPQSGINIGLDFFKLPDGSSPLFDTYIADLWRNTKDMVIYCGDILDVFTLDGGGGLAYVVYGAIGVGVIGGIFSKFLL